MKTEEEWQIDLGFSDLWIVAEDNIDVVVGMVPRAREKNSYSYKYVRPRRFWLRGCQIGEGVLVDDTDLGWLETAELRWEDAVSDNVSLYNEGDAPLYPFDWKVFFRTLEATQEPPCNMLFLRKFYVEPEYRGKGLVKHLFERALAFHEPSKLSIVVARQWQNLSHEDLSGAPDLSDLDETLAREKLVAVLVELGFEPEPTFGADYHIRTLSEPSSGRTRYDVLMSRSHKVVDVLIDMLRIE